jgi:hypothetical protein
MWLHHRDIIVSGKLRCSGKNADDSVVPLPSYFRLGRTLPFRLATVLGTALQQDGTIPVGPLEFTWDRERIFGRRSISGREDNYGITDIL